MEEKKQRNKFYSAWAKGIVIALFLTAVACFSVFAMIFGGLMRQGFSWEELTSNYYNGKNYLETQDCGQRMASQVNKVRNALSDGKPFLTKGKLDKTKLVDITRLDAKTSQQNPATTYTVEDLLKLKDNDLWDEFQDAIWNAGNGFYEEYDEDDEEYYEDDDENATSAAEDVDISDYTPRFRYLYNYARDFETVLPESGETLAEYARTNPKKVSLFDLYQQLSNAIDQLRSYQSKIKMDDKVIDHETIRSANIYLIIYIFMIGISILLVSLNGFDLVTTMTSVIACTNNIGPGLGVVGPMGNFSSLSILSKLVLILDMLM